MNIFQFCSLTFCFVASHSFPLASNLSVFPEWHEEREGNRASGPKKYFYQAPTRFLNSVAMTNGNTRSHCTTTCIRTLHSPALAPCPYVHGSSGTVTNSATSSHPASSVKLIQNQKCHSIMEPRDRFKRTDQHLTSPVSRLVNESPSRFPVPSSLLYKIASHKCDDPGEELSLWAGRLNPFGCILFVLVCLCYI